MPSVLVISEDRPLLDRLGDALQNEGMWAVCVNELAGAVEALREGFRPEAIVLDPALALEPGGGELVLHLTATPGLAGVPVLAISSPLRRRATDALVTRLRQLAVCGEAESAAE
jgi:DNA-binding response OmpR family regulator